MFLTMMGEHLYDFDAESELLAAFECFDEADSGFVKCDEIRKWLGDVGERMDEHEVSLGLGFFDSVLGIRDEDLQLKPSSRAMAWRKRC